MNVLALDIETKNYSHEIGGWGNTHMFQVSTVCTWDGKQGTVYIDEPIGSIRKSNVAVKPLSQLKFDLDELIEWADALNILRIQKERMGQALIPSVREYRSSFGITLERLRNHKKEITIMHPGPMNRGVEIDSGVADSEQAIILDQVLNGVASRMSILYCLCGGLSNEMEQNER